jgi:zinc/manganese transport system permease protein
MSDTWIVATVVAFVAGVVGFFTVLRGSTFVAHAVPQVGFAGAAAASLAGTSTILGLGVFALAGALGIGWLGRRGRHDVVTALALVLMLGVGALLLSFSSEYAPEIYSLIFGEVLGIASSEVLPSVLLGAASVAAMLALYRPLMLTSVLTEIGEARGVRAYRMEMCFLAVVALVTTMSVPVVGALLVFSLLIGPPAAARSFTDRPGVAIVLSVVIAVATVWASIVASYLTNWPIGFFVGVGGSSSYVIGRLFAGWKRSRRSNAPHPLGTSRLRPHGSA